jgi:glycosyltransferase involved in cell wall biosynthesis
LIVASPIANRGQRTGRPALWQTIAPRGLPLPSPRRGKQADFEHRLIRLRRKKGRVLFVGQSYYHAWYLSRELRKLGWRADVLNWDPNPKTQMYYHGEDYRFRYRSVNYGGKSERARDAYRHAAFFAWALSRYDIFHFSNMHGLRFGDALHNWAADRYSEAAEVRLLKRLGKKIVYSNNGCLDGVLQSTFNAWGPEPTCEICPWRTVPSVCSDNTNRAWGELRNSLADYQVTTGGNRADWNDDPSVHEVPEFYCLDSEVWRPDVPIPPEHRIEPRPGQLRLYHAVGNADERVAPGTRQSLKSTHVWFPLAERLRSEGRDVELFYATNIPNRDVRYYQLQSDIVCDMLTLGWFGSNVREAMMLGKPAICYLRPVWLEQIRERVPGYVEELPVVSATPETVHDVVSELLDDPAKRQELGRAGREFALTWHSAEAGARRFDEIYSELLETR